MHTQGHSWPLPTPVSADSLRQPKHIASQKTSSPCLLQIQPFPKVPPAWNAILVPAPAVLPGQLLCKAPWDLLVHAHFSSSCPSRVALVWSALGPPSPSPPQFQPGSQSQKAHVVYTVDIPTQTHIPREWERYVSLNPQKHTEQDR